MLKLQKTILVALLPLLLPLSTMAAVVSGEIFAIDGDSAGGVNDLSISLVEFTVAESGSVTVDVTAGFLVQLSALENTVEVATSAAGDSLVINAVAGNNYIIAVGQLTFFRDDALRGFIDTSSLYFGSTGEWTIAISDNAQLVSEVPVPGALPLFVSAVMGLVAVRRRQA